MRKLCALLISTCVLLPACGGGGGGGSGSGNSQPGTAVTLYVRSSGSDDDVGTSPDHAFQTIARARQLLAADVTVYVGPGRYTGGIDINRIEGTSAAAPVQLIGDAQGDHTGDAPGEVVIDGNGDGFAISITRTPFVVIDGFIITGAAPDGQGILVRSSSTSVTIRNCVITNGGPATGIRVQSASHDMLIFDNLLFDNDRGIRVDDSVRARIINNTIVSNDRTGISIGAGAPGATLRNNIIQNSMNNVSIAVDEGPPSSRDGYTGNFDLSFAAPLGDQTKAYLPASVRGEQDINEDAQFVDAVNGDFRLTDQSPAIDGGTDDIGADLLSALLARTTTTDDQPDRSPADIGYHYPIPK